MTAINRCATAVRIRSRPMVALARCQIWVSPSVSAERRPKAESDATMRVASGIPATKKIMAAANPIRTPMKSPIDLILLARSRSCATNGAAHTSRARRPALRNADNDQSCYGHGRPTNLEPGNDFTEEDYGKNRTQNWDKEPITRSDGRAAPGDAEIPELVRDVDRKNDDKDDSKPNSSRDLRPRLIEDRAKSDDDHGDRPNQQLPRGEDIWRVFADKRPVDQAVGGE